jgi:hypothetical protein
MPLQRNNQSFPVVFFEAALADTIQETDLRAVPKNLY